jgi:AhpD family alkylhydroperoxidase
MIRASQINGCGFCTDMHGKDAAQAGETSVRLNLIAAWREADAAGGVTDDAWANAAKHYDEDQLAALVSLISVINAYNRINVIIKQPAGDYQPGQWGNGEGQLPSRVRAAGLRGTDRVAQVGQ